MSSPEGGALKNFEIHYLNFFRLKKKANINKFPIFIFLNDLIQNTFFVTCFTTNVLFWWRDVIITSCVKSNLLMLMNSMRMYCVYLSAQGLPVSVLTLDSSRSQGHILKIMVLPQIGGSGAFTSKEVKTSIGLLFINFFLVLPKRTCYLTMLLNRPPPCPLWL